MALCAFVRDQTNYEESRIILEPNPENDRDSLNRTPAEYREGILRLEAYYKRYGFEMYSPGTAREKFLGMSAHTLPDVRRIVPHLFRR